MPKEVIHSNIAESGGEPVRAVVGWSREPGHVEITVQFPHPMPHPTTRTIADVLRDELTDPKWSNDSNYAIALNRMVAVYSEGWYCQLDRNGINRLIRTLRKARDAAYGSDA